MEDVKTGVQEETGSTEAVKEETAGNESLLGQETTPSDVEDKSTKDLNNPLTDDVEDAQEEEKKTEEKNEINFDEITLPEGITIDEDFKPLSIELNLSQDQTQKLVDYKIKADKKAAEANQAQFNEVVENLQKETKEMLGANYNKEMSYAARVMNLLPKEDQNELKEVLNISGIGNHPKVVKMMIAAGKALSEDKFVDGNKTNTPMSTADVLFGDMNLKK